MDMSGRRLGTTLHREFLAGNHLLHQRLIGNDGTRISNGVYVVDVTAAGVHAQEKIVMVNH
jgi:hypothetical protein